MNLDYIKNTIIPQREIEDKTATSKNPIYIVYSRNEIVVSGHSDYVSQCHVSSDTPRYSYISRADEDEPTLVDFKTDEPVTVITQPLVAGVFLTRKGAEEYMKYQKHNLRLPFIYEESCGYRNHEMEMVFSK